MRKLLFLCVPLFFAFVLMASYLSFVCADTDYKIIGDNINDALKLKEAGDINGAILTIERALSITDAADSTDSENKYTKKYLQILITYLRVDEITYAVVINHTASIIKKTRDVFFEIADELNTGKISAGSASKIKEMKLRMSREMIAHSFCVPPEGYKEAYDVTQEALFWYSKAWGNLYLVTLKKTNEKTKLEVEALLNFQKGNELFSQAGTHTLAISKK